MYNKMLIFREIDKFHWGSIVFLYCKLCKYNYSNIIKSILKGLPEIEEGDLERIVRSIRTNNVTLKNTKISREKLSWFALGTFHLKHLGLSPATGSPNNSSLVIEEGNASSSITEYNHPTTWLHGGAPAICISHRSIGTSSTRFASQQSILILGPPLQPLLMAR